MARQFIIGAFPFPLYLNGNGSRDFIVNGPVYVNDNSGNTYNVSISESASESASASAAMRPSSHSSVR